MGPKKHGVSRTVLTINTKRGIIAEVESGQKMADVDRQYGLNMSTVCTILAKKDIIKKTQDTEGVTKIPSAKQRSAIHDKMVAFSLVWINEREMKRDVTSSSSEELEFKTTTGWFTKFKRRSGIKHVLTYGESASADKEAAEKYCLKFQEFIETEGYRPEQIFNCNETSLFWKRMPNRSYITKNEKSVSGLKPMKDRLTLLLGANASDDMKLKPLLNYHSENPRALKKIPFLLPVTWTSNQRAWVTQDLFKEGLFKVYPEHQRLP
ncbi:tigger transposable element-derived protein 1 [Trichonephila clavipes]|nr:tigger transposable element-derived protein 1 [Trichonephila clavipes]